MLEFDLSISRDGTNFYSVDLFPDARLSYSVDFYDSLDIDKIKMPFYSEIKVPLTVSNMDADRFDFDPEVSTGADFPRDDFFFNLKIFGNSTQTIAGVLNVKSIEYNSNEPYIDVELKDQLAYYLAKVKEVSMAELYTQSKYTTQTTLKTFTNYDESNVSFNGQRGVIGTDPDSSAAIVFPYVDMNNDLEKFGEPQRAFLEYGTGIRRTNLIPAFSVQRFLEYVGDYLSTVGFPVRVDSKLFAVGQYDGSPHDPNFEPEKLRFINDAHLLAKQSVNTRTFTLNQANEWVGTNASMEYINGTYTQRSASELSTYPWFDEQTKWFKTSYYGNSETFGNGGGAGPNEYAQREFGLRKQKTPTTSDGIDRDFGFFCPRVSYNANLRLNGNPTNVTVSGLSVEMPIVGEEDMIYDLSITNVPDFKVYIGIFEDEVMVRKVALVYVNGDDLILNPTGRDYANSNKNDLYSTPDYLSGLDEPVILWNNTSLLARDTYTFDSFTAYFPTDINMQVNGGSRYSVNYFAEPVTDVYVKATTGFGRTTVPVDHWLGLNTNATTFVTYPPQEFKKMITRIPTFAEHSKLAITFLANEDFLPHRQDDEFVIKDSIAATTEETIYTALLKIAKRFNCGLFYEYDDSANTNVLRVDPIQIMRSGTQNISTLVDDSKSIKISRGGSRIKSLLMENEDYGRYFDKEKEGAPTVGSTTQVINPEGTDEHKIRFESSIFYKSLCGEESFEKPTNLTTGAFSEYELGLSKNIFSQNDEIGFRFAYVKAPSYKTYLLHPSIQYTDDLTFTGAMKSETERIYISKDLGFNELSDSDALFIFNGELSHVNASGWDLRAEDENGSTTDYYDLYSSSDSLKLANNSTIEFDMVIPTSDLGNLDFFMQTLSASNITPSSIYVKSADGQVYGDYAYLTIEGLIQ